MTLEASWRKAVGRHALTGLARLDRSLAAARSCFYPPPEIVLRAFAETPFWSVKVVILGQDPYPRKGEADGLAFSVASGAALPRSLRQIFKELQRDLGMHWPSTGDLGPWAGRGVLLLNTV